MTKDELLELADRCEMEHDIMSSPLDVDIARAVGVQPIRVFRGGIDADEEWPPYTTSLDSAVTLVPEGCAWRAGCAIDFTPVAVVFGHDVHADADASTPALALCAAALRARASLTEKG